jgi:hypothetical protein
MCELQNNIEVAAEHISWIKNVIADWMVIVDDLRRAGCRTECAENTLQAFISTLKTLELYEMCLREESDRQDGPRRETIAA